MSTSHGTRLIQRCTAHLSIFSLLMLSPTLVTAGACPQGIVISQVYGGGTGAIYKNDFRRPVATMLMATASSTR